MVCYIALFKEKTKHTWSQLIQSNLYRMEDISNVESDSFPVIRKYIRSNVIKTIKETNFEKKKTLSLFFFISLSNKMLLSKCNAIFLIAISIVYFNLTILFRNIFLRGFFLTVHTHRVRRVPGVNKSYVSQLDGTVQREESREQIALGRSKE